MSVGTNRNNQWCTSTLPSSCFICIFLRLFSYSFSSSSFCLSISLPSDTRLCNVCSWAPRRRPMLCFCSFSSNLCSNDSCWRLANRSSNILMKLIIHIYGFVRFWYPGWITVLKVSIPDKRNTCALYSPSCSNGVNLYASATNWRHRPHFKKMFLGISHVSIHR